MKKDNNSMAVTEEEIVVKIAEGKARAKAIKDAAVSTFDAIASERAKESGEDILVVKRDLAVDQMVSLLDPLKTAAEGHHVVALGNEQQYMSLKKALRELTKKEKVAPRVSEQDSISNQTGHRIVVYTEYNEMVKQVPMMRFKASEEPAKIAHQRRKESTSNGIPFFRESNSIVDLPRKKDGVIYIVMPNVYHAIKAVGKSRTDVCTPVMDYTRLADDGTLHVYGGFKW